MSKRMAIFVDETMRTPYGYVPAAVIEDEPGYHPLIGGNDPSSQPWYWGHDLTVAKRLATEANAKLGLSTSDALDIIASSLRAALVADSRRESATDRWDRIKRGLPPRPEGY